ncbi:hypothetical protein [Magnetospirillum sulfuroxidans]|uniref:Uncharacterized protein n=1 Tax=Magnetospirillum sulfuroxidans TaxID=611300 RepID=A0ABS5IH78_9PROT|nr:hypothetical protein [Magnetospirillum sulfuroxidans]MBR9973777.1 hypothetical protein [Magnetospirillum sulfuroxidans]
MGKGKKDFYPISKATFDKEIRVKLEGELRKAANVDNGPPGGAAGGLSNSFDSLTAVVMLAVVIPAHLGDMPPAEKIIREGGYETVDDFIEDIIPKLRALCADPLMRLELDEDNEDDRPE